MKKINDNFISSTLPYSISKDRNLQTFSKLSDKALEHIIPHIDDGILLASLDTLSSGVLDHMAAQWRVKVWRDSWPVEIKRQVLKALITEKSRQGTLLAIKNSVASFGSAVAIKEWWQTEPKGVPHTFSLVLDQTELPGIITEELLDDIRRLIDDAKPVRSQYTVTIMQKGFVNVYRHQVARHYIYKRIDGNLQSYDKSQVRLNRFNAVRPMVYKNFGASKKYPNEGVATLYQQANYKGRAVIFKRI